MPFLAMVKRKAKTADIIKKGILGIPGIKPKISKIPDAIPNAFGTVNSCEERSVPKLDLDVDFVISKAAEIAFIREGIWVTNPSPTVKRV